MTTQEIFDLGIKLGIKNDLRGEQKVKAFLDRAKVKYEKLSKEAKEEFDEEKLEKRLFKGIIIQIGTF